MKRRYKLNREHYSKNKDKHAEAVIKSRNTIKERYGDDGISKLRTNMLHMWYTKEKQYLDSLDIIDKKDVTNFLLNKRDKFVGKSGNRKLKRDNPQIYKSLIFHCDEYKKYYGNKKIPFVAMLDIAIDGFLLDDDKLCPCKNRLKFDPITQKWSKFYCRNCLVSPTSKRHFKNKYGNDWEDYWDKLRENFYVVKGINETSILDSVENTQGIVIDRSFSVLNYYPDGYCKENNTIYEVYESHHKRPSNIIRDKIRQDEIQQKLKCDFVILWDLEVLDIEIHKYV